MSRPSTWTDAQDDVLRACAAQGASAADAGRALKRSRHACQRRAKRIGAPFTARPGERANTRTRAPSKRALRRRGIRAIDMRPTPFLETRARQCRFPINDEWRGDRLMCCGAPAPHGQSYCPGHRRLAYRHSHVNLELLAERLDKYERAQAARNRAGGEDAAFVAAYINEHCQRGATDAAADY